MAVTGDSYNFYTDANILDEVADQSSGEFSGDALIQVDTELVIAIVNAAEQLA